MNGFRVLEEDGIKGFIDLLRREIRTHNATLLVLDGLIAIEVSEQEGWQHYSATAAGNARAKQVLGFLREPVVHYLRRVVGWASTRSFEQLVRQPFDPGVAVPEPSDARSLHPR